AEVRPLLVDTGQPAIADDIGRENGPEPSFYALAGQSTLRKWYDTKLIPSAASAKGRLAAIVHIGNPRRSTIRFRSPRAALRHISQPRGLPEPAVDGSSTGHGRPARVT